jgi:hypothetical protein
MRAVQRKGRLVLLAVISFGVILALVVLLTAASPRNLDGIAPVFFAALAFNVLSLIARWILTKNRRPIFLLAVSLRRWNRKIIRCRGVCDIDRRIDPRTGRWSAVRGDYASSARDGTRYLCQSDLHQRRHS